MILLSKQNPSKKLNRKIIPIIIGIILVGSILGYYTSMVSTPPGDKLSTPQDIYLVARHDPEKGFIFAIKETDGALYTYSQISEINVKKDQLVSIHLVNGDKDEKHDFNIDEFNVHTKDLWYFEGDTSTFVANKIGTFRYYCSLHPEMNGNFTVK